MFIKDGDINDTPIKNQHLHAFIFHFFALTPLLTQLLTHSFIQSVSQPVSRCLFLPVAHPFSLSQWHYFRVFIWIISQFQPTNKNSTTLNRMLVLVSVLSMFKIDVSDTDD